MNVFVTVGTTQFQGLIDTILSADLLEVLVARGYSRLVIQKGKSTILASALAGLPIEVDIYDYKPTLMEDILRADLVIAHAGAGTALEVLEKAQKPLIVVVNETLMNNHQIELAEKLAQGGHCQYCYCSTLTDTLQDFQAQSLRPFPPGQPELFADYFDQVLQAHFDRSS